jgi:hypothetical protein
MGPIRNPNWSTSGMRVTSSYLMVNVLASRAVARGFQPRSDQIKYKMYYKIGFYCFSAKEKEQRLVGSESG